jgi:prepilin-type N-terminal cleavage/methylation domain-containing protein
MPRGLTLVEMLVVLALLGVVASIAAVALPPVAAPPASTALDSLATARRTAITSGRPVTVVLSFDSGPARRVTAFPDGRVVADSDVPVDLFTGRVNAAR